MGQPSGPGLLSFWNYFNFPSSSSLMIGEVISSAISWSTNLGKCPATWMILARFVTGGSLNRCWKCDMPSCESWWKVFAIPPFGMGNFQIVLEAFLPLAKFWKYLVFSSPTLSQIVRLLSLQVSSRSFKILALLFSSSIRFNLASTLKKPLLLSSIRSVKSDSIEESVWISLWCFSFPHLIVSFLSWRRFWQNPLAQVWHYEGEFCVQ